MSIILALPLSLLLSREVSNKTPVDIECESAYCTICKKYQRVNFIDLNENNLPDDLIIIACTKCNYIFDKSTTKFKELVILNKPRYCNECSSVTLCKFNSSNLRFWYECLECGREHRTDYDSDYISDCDYDYDSDIDSDSDSEVNVPEK